MKKLLNKNSYLIILITVLVGMIIHFSIYTKNLLSADILLYDSYYNSYLWEISLGRFGLFIVGLLKSYLSVPIIEVFSSLVILGIINVILLDFLKIKNKYLNIVFITCTPIVSCILLFYYCSFSYMISMLSIVLSIYLLYKLKSKYKYLISIMLTIIALSIYQASISIGITLIAIYSIKLLFDNNFKIKELMFNIISILIGLFIYYILVKISISLFHINISDYSNANNLNILELIKTIPNKIIDSYNYFYYYFFGNNSEIIKNYYMKNHILNYLLFIVLGFSLIIKLINSKSTIGNKIFIIVLILLLPIFMNSISFIVPISKFQLLMGGSYLVFYYFLFSLIDTKFIKVISIILICLLLRNYIVQDQATYLSLNNTKNKYDTVIDSVINNNINDLDKEFMIYGSLSKSNNFDKIYKMNYGFVGDLDIFWGDDYTNSKNGFIRYMYFYKGLDINYVNEDDYNKLLKSKEFKKINNYYDVINDKIVIKFS